MLICANHSIGIVVIQKAGSNTIMNAIRDSGHHWIEMSARDFANLPERIALIRQPHARIESAYRMYSTTGCGRRHQMSSFHDFVMGICEDDDNDPHVMPQLRLCAPKGEFLPNRLLRWDFATLFRILGAKKRHDFPSDGSITTEWTVAAREAFDEVYEEDLKMWNAMTPYRLPCD